jgi:hypothetical protein
MNNNTLASIGLGMILLTAFALAGTAAYESIVGLADLFAARQEVVIIMAVFIEWAKLLLAGTLHMFWKTLPWWKWGGVAIVAVHMAVTNIGIYSYLSSGYTLQEAPVAALERQIDEVDRRVQEQEIIASEAVQRVEAMDVAYREYVENLYVRRAEQYKQTNADLRAQLEAQRDDARLLISQLEKSRVTLSEAKVENAAKLGSIEHITALTGNDENVLKVVAMFTLLLIMGLDPAALLMVILFAHLLGKLIHKDESSSEIKLSEEEITETKRLQKIGYLKDRTKGRKR